MGMRPRFYGIVRGELLKIVQFRAARIIVVVLISILSLPWLALLLSPSQKALMQATPQFAITLDTQGNLSVLRIFLGFVVAILAVLAVGTDYEQGTIRIVLARGVGRVHLLAAKTMALLAVIGMVWLVALIWEGALGAIVFTILGNGLSTFGHLDQRFWLATAQYLLTISISVLATLALSISVTVLGRSRAFGFAVALGFFPTDNFSTLIFEIFARVTKDTFWFQVTRYLLGPNLNTMPTVLLPHITRIVQAQNGPVTAVSPALSLGPRPLIGDDFTHTLMVALVWMLSFVIIAVVLTWRKDVLE
jgi:ABC-type transport system involved in multi-copper enzyme maturation permease subunit